MPYLFPLVISYCKLSLPRLKSLENRISRFILLFPGINIWPWPSLLFTLSFLTLLHHCLRCGKHRYSWDVRLPQNYPLSLKHWWTSTGKLLSGSAERSCKRTLIAFAMPYMLKWKDKSKSHGFFFLLFFFFCFKYSFLFLCTKTVRMQKIGCISNSNHTKKL